MKTILLKLDAHLRLFIALAVSLIVFLLTIGRLELSVQAIAVWNVFAWTMTRACMVTNSVGRRQDQCADG